jgi:hypothetical protein
MKNWDKILNYCYTELYKNSTPKANFSELVKNAKLNKFGQKDIPFMDYEIEQDKMSKIIEQTVKKFKLEPYYAKSLRFKIYLGCSPKIKLNETK